ncbi:TonB C-terminal domain-containing protein [Microvirga terricola]|uniref:TonB C-terminal domain-containing protein n=1 Tax=Microvirga terricola TaxID=2719797 RepID=A0ABX0VD39_9HYPH|nr:TonB C-terminal domain-containing protein [Microvirga terricola]NIX77762.1 TonB C-terminal domain-containing protein [Microvirga terricola]
MRLGPAFEAWRVCATLLGFLATTPLMAQERPETPSGVIRPQGDQPRLERINRLSEVFDAIQACWHPPAGSGFSGQEITLQISFKRNGEVLGQPKIRYYNPGTQPEQREAFTRAVRQAFEQCTPLPVTEGLGAAIAGRPFIFRFVDTRPM